MLQGGKSKVVHTALTCDALRGNIRRMAAYLERLGLPLRHLADVFRWAARISIGRRQCQTY